MNIGELRIGECEMYLYPKRAEVVQVILGAIFTIAGMIRVITLLGIKDKYGTVLISCLFFTMGVQAFGPKRKHNELGGIPASALFMPIPTKWASIVAKILGFALFYVYYNSV